MDEQKTTQGQAETRTGEDSPNGIQPQAASIIETANAAAQRLASENDRLERNISALQEIEAYKKLGGTTEGRPKEEEKKEETPQEYKERVMKGDLNK